MHTQTPLEWRKMSTFNRMMLKVLKCINLCVFLVSLYKIKIMKKIVFIALSCMLLSCSSYKNVMSKQKVIKGNWTLNEITYNQKGTFNVTLLNDVSKECFEGSSWNFIPNNNTGSYTINNADCASGARDFVFSIKELNKLSGYFDFLLKPKNNPKNEGFRLELIQLSETNMQWQQFLTVDGKPFTISMNFNKQ
jgi:hypothetical protein